eukprot:scaffold2923_cov313-Pinguiococcus_pyrenoidosus.AAC.14
MRRTARQSSSRSTAPVRICLLPGCSLRRRRSLTLSVILGNIPNKRRTLLKTLVKAHKRGILVVAVTQCVTGSVVSGIVRAVQHNDNPTEA